MDIIVSFKDGVAEMIYNDNILLNDLGNINIKRASYVEPDQNGNWIADMSPIKNIKLGPYKLRSEALDAERNWLNKTLFKVV